MIYEKRYSSDKTKPDNASKLCYLESVAGKKGESENMINKENKSTAKDVRRVTRKKRGVRRRFSERLATGFVVFCVALGIVYADARFLDFAILLKGAEITRALADEVKSGETSSPPSKTHQRTLYTLDYADSTSEHVPAERLASEDTADAVQTCADAVPAVQGYADGERLLPITEMNLASDSLLSITNETKFSPDIKTLSQIRPSALEQADMTKGPLVLVLHTHACESYTQYEGAYPEDEPTRSQDTSNNVVAVGEEICNTLSDFGVPAVHCTKLHDGESFINAYSNSAASVKSYLEKYPSIRFVIDVHRDAIIRDDGESIKAVTEISGEKYAQLMFVVGTNQLGHNHPGWQDNLSLALMVQESIDSTYPSLCRSINLRNVPFNQQLSSGYLLLEVGTSANTLTEALRSARAFGENLARVILTA